MRFSTKHLCLIVAVTLSVALQAASTNDGGQKSVVVKSPGTSGYAPTLIDVITPATLPSGVYTVETRITPPGGSTTGAGILVDFKVGVGDRVMLGVGYGGDGLVGRGDVRWYPWPSVLAKVRFLDESYGGPALVFGFSSYGSGGRATNYRGFTYKSKGFFVTASKGFFISDNSKIDFHWDISYSLENIQTVKWPNTTIALDFRLFQKITTILEYDLALNQIDINETDGSYAKPHHGFLGFGFRWRIVPRFALQLNMQDLIQQRTAGADVGQPQGWGREVRLTYQGSF